MHQRDVVQRFLGVEEQENRRRSKGGENQSSTASSLDQLGGSGHRGFGSGSSGGGGGGGQPGPAWGEGGGHDRANSASSAAGGEARARAEAAQVQESLARIVEEAQGRMVQVKPHDSKRSPSSAGGGGAVAGLGDEVPVRTDLGEVGEAAAEAGGVAVKLRSWKSGSDWVAAELGRGSGGVGGKKNVEDLAAHAVRELQQSIGGGARGLDDVVVSFRAGAGSSSGGA